MLEIVEIRAPRYADANGTAIIMDVRFKEEADWSPFVARPTDTIGRGAEIFERAETGEFGQITAHVELMPSTDPADYPLTPAQFKALVTYLGKDDEIRAAIGQIPDGMSRAWALSRYENAASYLYDDELLQQMRAAVGMSESDLAEAWMLAKDLRSA